MEQRKFATVVGTFDTDEQASRAIDDLHAAGFTDDEIHVDRELLEGADYYESARRSGSGVGRTLLGALLGAIIGGLIGAALAGALPGIGAVVAIGTPTAIFAGAVIGALLGGILGAISGGGRSDAYPDRRITEQTTVRVRSREGMDEARAILGRYGASGPDLQQAATAQALHQPSRDETLRIPLVEEELVANKSMQQMGTLHVHKEVEQAPGRLEVEAERDEVVVEHVPIGEIVAERREPWEEDGQLVVPIYEEQLVVVKRLVMKEQIRIRRTPTTERQVFEDTVRRERLVVDDPDGTNSVRERYATERGNDEIIAETWDGQRNDRPVDG